jgi:hypothetical protein
MKRKECAERAGLAATREENRLVAGMHKQISSKDQIMVQKGNRNVLRFPRQFVGLVFSCDNLTHRPDEAAEIGHARSAMPAT